MLCIDRHGKPVKAVLRAKQSADETSLGYIGTSAGFGAFTAETAFIANDGKKWRLKDVVASGGISDLRFENLSRIPESTTLEPSVEELWPQIVSNASCVNGECVALLCRDPEYARASECRFAEVVRLANQVFIVVARKKFEAALNRDWCKTIAAFCGTWLMNSKDERLEFERSLHPLALWYAAAQCRLEAGYEFRYDTMQHSSYLFVSTGKSAPSPLQKGRCAFFVPSKNKAVKLEWTDLALALIAGGFLLAAN